MVGQSTGTIYPRSTLLRRNFPFLARCLPEVLSGDLELEPLGLQRVHGPGGRRAKWQAGARGAPQMQTARQAEVVSGKSK